ncbi:MAG: type VI secretion system tip protein VgrG [Acidobacteriia bacterium]|nr:type VI secretion system tip protein VgrG [Terriglobia bacterium]
MTYTQENRLMAIATPLGDDAVLLAGLSGEEGISRLFRFDLELLSSNESIDFDAIVGGNVTVRLTLADGNDRYFNGYISRFSQGERQRDLISYHAEVVPWLWFLTRTSDCRIFQQKKVPDIVKQIFDEMGFQDYKLQLYGDFVEREYCVQYRETDFNFVSRLLEEEGIFYFFQHDDGVHTLVLANDPSAHQPCSGQSQARYEVGSGAAQEDDVIQEWRVQSELRPGVYAQADYNFEQPSQALKSSVTGKNPYEIYDYHPGEYRKPPDGDDLVRTRLQELEGGGLVARGSSDCRAFLSGYRFELTGHFRSDMNQTWLLTAVRHVASQPGDFRSQGSLSGGDLHYQNQFECIPYSTPFRPPRVTPHPVVQGSQTAIVVGPSDEEIFVDKYGRVKVQFHWDREGKSDENSSCWIRVAQNWAGKKWGVMFIPRIGQEVIVDFLEGDPDQPIITGRVYNAEQIPPYTLPDEKTKSTIKSLSSKGGGGFNEIRFEDKKGSEQIFIHAEKDLHQRVKDSRFETILGSAHLIVQQDQFEKIGGDTHLQVVGDQNEKVSGTASLNAGMDVEHKAGQNYAMDAGQEIHLKSGMNLVMESGTTLTLKVGGNFISINPSGVYISGTMVFINSGGSAGSGAGSSPQSPTDPTEADKAEPGEAATVSPGDTITHTKRDYGSTPISPAAAVLIAAAQSGVPFCEYCEQ